MGVKNKKRKMIKIGDKIIGKIHANKAGSAYFVSDEIAKDLYVYKKNRNTSLHLDLVEVEVIKGVGRALECKVLRIIERFRTSFVGVFENTGESGIVTPISNKMNKQIFVKPSQFNGALDNQKVVVSMDSWSKNGEKIYGSIIEIIGDSGDNEAEMHSIIHEYNLPLSFSQDVLDESSVISDVITSEDIEGRKDLRNVVTFTIDPESARDFDDALSLKQLPTGDYQVGVHIADVTHYVRPGTELDKEAFKRSTSVYLVDRVVPMLPEYLSNNVCSLRPNEDKLTFSVIFTIDRVGKIKNTWMGKTIIRSNKRYTYEEAEEIIQNPILDVPDDLKKYALDIKTLDLIATMLREDRFNAGAISLGRKEFKFDLDDNGSPKSINVKEHLKSQELIEEFMLLANKSVAEYVNKKQLPMVNRVHDKPDKEKLLELKAYLNNFGLKIKIGNETKSSINDILETVKDTPIENMVNNLVTRVMSKAIYSTNNIGHYGLGFENYTHFTSPIRRYSDMIVHRLLEMYLRGKSNISLPKLESRCEHISERERRAQKAERESVKYKQVEFMIPQVNTIHKGIVSSITNNVIFIELVENGVDGVLPIHNLGDNFEGDKSMFFIKQKDTGLEIKIGDEISVKILSADLDSRRLELGFFGITIE